MLDRRSLIAAAGFAAVAPAIVRMRSLMAMPRRPLWFPRPGDLYAKFFNGVDEVARLPMAAANVGGAVRLTAKSAAPMTFSCMEVHRAGDGLARAALPTFDIGVVVAPLTEAVMSGLVSGFLFDYHHDSGGLTVMPGDTVEMSVRVV